jgi:hypothetical protein
LEKVCDAVSNYDMQTVPEDFTAEAGNESCVYVYIYIYIYPACGGHSLHSENK